VAAAVSEVAQTVASPGSDPEASEEAAKQAREGPPPAPPAPVADASAARSAPQAWLSRLDAPEWGKAATALTRVAAWEVAGSVAAVAELAEACCPGHVQDTSGTCPI